MTRKDVPYFSPAGRVGGVTAGTAATMAGALAARLVIPESDVLLFVAACVAPPVLVLAVWRLWLGRRAPRMTRRERQRRYAIETLQAPYWQALLIHGAPAIIPPLVIVVLQSRSSNDSVLLLMVALAIAYLAAATTLHFERRRAQRLLGDTTAI
jgi:hypothetical protein